MNLKSILNPFRMHRAILNPFRMHRVRVADPIPADKIIFNIQLWFLGKEIEVGGYTPGGRDFEVKLGLDNLLYAPDMEWKFEEDMLAIESIVTSDRGFLHRHYGLTPELLGCAGVTEFNWEDLPLPDIQWISGTPPELRWMVPVACRKPIIFMRGGRFTNTWKDEPMFGFSS